LVSLKFVGGTIVLIAIVISLLVVLQFFPAATLPAQGGKRVDVSNINIKDVAYIVSSEKPKAMLASFASETATDTKQGTELTVYNQNFALVKEIRNLFLKEGTNLVEYRDVASQIDPTSVFFRDMQYPDTFVVEQNYEYDLVSNAKLLEKYIDQTLTVAVKEGDKMVEYTGKLLSYSDRILLQTDKGIVSLQPDKIVFPKLPENLRTKPTLVWKLFSSKAGERQTQTSYLTDDISWHAEYIAKVNPDDTKMDFKGWVSIDNKSGTAYPDTMLKLVAGDVHRVQDYRYNEAYDYAKSSAGATPQQFGEESLFEYYMYTLNRKTDVLNNQTKQISLLASEEVPVKKIFYYDGRANGTKVQTKLNFKNSEAQGLGLPLPKGKVRVYKEDSQGQLQFVGEDMIDHTPKDEEANLYLGDAFDIVGEWKQTDSTTIAAGYYRQSYEITLRNHKDTEVEIVVHEYAGSSWEITKKSDPFEKKTSNAVEFTVKVPANGSKTITYTIEHRYYW